MTESAIRRGRPSDLDAITRIYNHYVTNTHVTFALEPLGVLTEVGRKFDRYWDVAWYEKCLGAD